MLRKLLLSTLLFATLYVGGFAQVDAFIHEFDYDQPGTDNAEFVEVAVDLSSCVGACNPTDFTVVLYNGSNGSVYDTDALPMTAAGTDGIYSLFVINYPANGLQNGAPDGIALVYQGTLLQFLSYEGTFNGVGGAANLIMSTDVGVSENNDAPNLAVARNSSGGYGLLAPTPGAPNNSPLPVSLTTFKVASAGLTANLAWATATELENAFFGIEVSRDGRSFAEVGRVRGAGNSRQAKRYAFDWTAPATGAYYLRLRQVDFDGAISYSPVVVARLGARRQQLAITSTIVKDELLMETDSHTQIRIYNMSGAQLINVKLEGGRQAVDVSSLATGVYVVSNGETSLRFVK